MINNTSVQLTIRRVPYAVDNALAKEARRRGVSKNTVALERLAQLPAKPYSGNTGLAHGLGRLAGSGPLDEATLSALNEIENAP